MAAASSNQGRQGAGTADLDSHANMAVLGNQCTIIQRTGRYADVNSFASYVVLMARVPIVDAALEYDCPHSGRTFLLLSRNALFVESMYHNLVPPFIVREAGLEVDKLAKIHSETATKQHHLIYSKECDLRIALQLQGIFSVFNTRCLNEN